MEYGGAQAAPGEPLAGVGLGGNVSFTVAASALLLVLAWLCLGGLRGLRRLLGRPWRAYRSWNHRRYLAGLPAPSVVPEHVPARARELLSVICARTGPQRHVSLGDYFAARGWNEADVRLVTRELLNRGLVIGHPSSRQYYAPTPLGADLYGRDLMSDPQGININATHGSTVFGVNVHSEGATVQVGAGNHAAPRPFDFPTLVAALREDAATAQEIEALAARGHADDLEEAVATNDPARIDRVIGRVNALLVAATSAFAMTRGLLPPL
ncbi:hypothetical protein ACFVVA_23005 [Kitasatospora sp. NPDC058048]|uniref:hypothetical protein n=1 Tax=Kitasatospora sp. NPDC058048 TaxID=3346313 RepID=UPI0036DA4CD9